MYQKLRLYYMSGTGNTYRVARWMENKAKESGVETEVLSIFDKESKEKKPEKDSLTGFLVPCHAFTAPWSAIRYALSMPKGNGAHCFSVNTGEHAYKIGGRAALPQVRGITSYLIALILLLKGYKVRGIAGIEMPANWTLVMSGYKPDKVKMLKAEAYSFVEKYITKLLSGQKAFYQWYSLILGILLLPLSLAYLLMGRFFLSKLFFADERCNSCGICAKACPKKAIILKGDKNPRPYWRFKCESCMRCVGYCPQQAIQIGHSWIILLYLITNIPLSGWVQKGLSNLLDLPWIANSGLFGTALYCVQVFVVAALAYYLFNLLVRIPIINRIFTYTTFTRIFRRYHEPETSVNELK